MKSMDKPKDPIYVLMADDHVVVRAGLRMLIDSQPTMKVVGEAGTKDEVLALAGREQPDIILLDIYLGSENALEFMPELMAKAENARIIILTGFRDREEHQLAVRLGAMGVVLKDTTPQLMLKSIERVHAGEVWLDRFLTSKLIVSLRGNNKDEKQHDDENRIGKLSDREHEVIALVGEGLKNKQIADRLYISEITVRHHLTSIFEKLKVSDRLELLIFAYQKGLVKVSA
jgi:two-component system, NarL family, nitrate/nitrite response regulator NarL